VNDAPTAAADNYATTEDASMVVLAPGVLGGLRKSMAIRDGRARRRCDHGLTLSGRQLRICQRRPRRRRSTYTASDGTAVSSVATVTSRSAA
jgi:hypothetical protein